MYKSMLTSYLPAYSCCNMQPACLYCPGIGHTLLSAPPPSPFSCFFPDLAAASANGYRPRASPCTSLYIDRHDIEVTLTQPRVGTSSRWERRLWSAWVSGYLGTTEWEWCVVLGLEKRCSEPSPQAIDTRRNGTDTRF